MAMSLLVSLYIEIKNIIILLAWLKDGSVRWRTEIFYGE